MAPYLVNYFTYLLYCGYSIIRYIYLLLFIDDSIGLSSSISLDPGGCGSTEFCLVWDMPVIKYKKDSKIHKRYAHFKLKTNIV